MARRWMSANREPLRQVGYMIRVLANRTDIMLATHWSLHNNDAADGSNRFGSFYSDASWQPQPLPIYQVLKLLFNVLRDHAYRLPLTRTKGNKITTPDLGYASAATIALVLINKSPQKAQVGAITLTGREATSASYTLLFTTTVLATDGKTPFQEQTGTIPVKTSTLTVRLPAASVGLVTLKLL